MKRTDYLNTHREAWDALERKLLWLYGAERAAAILSGNDPETTADLVAWRSLGRARG